jgi:hypothetical protein
MHLSSLTITKKQTEQQEKPEHVKHTHKSLKEKKKLKGKEKNIAQKRKVGVRNKMCDAQCLM